MTTPSAYRMATIVVPWRMSGVSPWSTGFGSCPSRRNSWEKLGPGLSPGGKKGRLMSSHKLAGVGPYEFVRPPADQGVEVDVEVIRSRTQQARIVRCVTEQVIAGEAEQGPD